MFKLRSILMACLVVGFFVAAAPAANAGGCCDPCCVPCCQPCPPPPVPVTLCVKDPCTCCTYQVDVCIPPCCKDSEVCVSWRGGWFGRKIATYTWKCCGHSVDIVITKHGRVIVRG